jgi:hypothetical protein
MKRKKKPPQSFTLRERYISHRKNRKAGHLYGGFFILPFLRPLISASTSIARFVPKPSFLPNGNGNAYGIPVFITSLQT